VLQRVVFGVFLPAVGQSEAAEARSGLTERPTSTSDDKRPHVLAPAVPQPPPASSNSAAAAAAGGGDVILIAARCRLSRFRLPQPAGRGRRRSVPACARDVLRRRRLQQRVDPDRGPPRPVGVAARRRRWLQSGRGVWRKQNRK